MVEVLCGVNFTFQAGGFEFSWSKFQLSVEPPAISCRFLLAWWKWRFSLVNSCHRSRHFPRICHTNFLSEVGEQESGAEGGKERLANRSRSRKFRRRAAEGSQSLLRHMANARS